MIRKILFGLGVMALIVTFMVIIFRAGCYLREEPPHVPVFPNSQLTRTDLEIHGSSHANYIYETANDQSDVIAFYEALGNCYKISKGDACVGEANLFGRYTIYIYDDINSPSGITLFIVYITWNRHLCEEFG